MLQNPQSLEQSANSVWASDVRIVHPLNGWTAQGIEEAKQHQTLFHEIFPQAKVTDYSVQYDRVSVRKIRVNWSLTGTFAATVPSAVASTLGPIWSQIASKSVQFKGFSFITFEDHKIVQDVRTLDLMHLMVELQKCIPATHMSAFLQLLTCS